MIDKLEIVARRINWVPGRLLGWMNFGKTGRKGQYVNVRHEMAATLRGSIECARPANKAGANGRYASDDGEALCSCGACKCTVRNWVTQYALSLTSWRVSV